MKGFGAVQRGCVILILTFLPTGMNGRAMTLQGQEEQDFDIDYLPPMPSDLLKRERKTDQAEQLSNIRKMVVASTKAKKIKTKRKRVQANMLMLQAHAQQAAQDQEIFDLIKKQYEDRELQDAKISLQVKKMPIKEVMKLVCRMTEIPFVVDSDVQGEVVDFAVQNLPLAAALHSMLASNEPRLALMKDLGVWRVMKYQAAKEYFAGLVARERAKDVVAGVYALTRVQWTAALKHRIEKLWEGLVQASPEKQFFYMVMDEANNKIFFKTRKAYADEFTKYLQELDIKAPEVRIDVRVVSADKDFEESFGFNWSGVYNRRASVKQTDFVGVGPTQITNGNGATNDSDYKNIVGWAFNLIPDTVSKIVKLPFVFGNKDMNTKRLTLELDAAERRAEIQTILKPSLLVHNEETAEILVGRELPLSVRLEENITGATTNVTTVRYKDIGTKLKVTPAVSPNQKEIFLDIFVENSKVDYILDENRQLSSGNTNAPFNYAIGTSRSQNRVLLRSGETTMIGGLITNHETHIKQGVPFLQDIPVVNIFFTWKQKKIEERQLLIFITPTLEMA
jgi:type IV pilus assembly protein PilQ